MDVTEFQTVHNAARFDRDLAQGDSNLKLYLPYIHVHVHVLRSSRATWTLSYLHPFPDFNNEFDILPIPQTRVRYIYSRP